LTTDETADYDCCVKGIMLVSLSWYLGLLGGAGEVPPEPLLSPPNSTRLSSPRQEPPGDSREPKNSARAKPDIKKKSPAPHLTVKESTERRRQARDAIAAGDFKTARRLLQEARGITVSTEKQAWLLIRAEVELADKQFAKAGLAAMRVVILYPDSEHGAEALYWAGRSYEGLQRSAKAIELYEECLTHQGTNASIHKLVTARLKALEKQADDR
jgi:tetratricopeptide (TPR) repeat protein